MSKNKVYKSFIGLGYYETLTPGVIQRNVRTAYTILPYFLRIFVILLSLITVFLIYVDLMIILYSCYFTYFLVLILLFYISHFHLYSKSYFFYYLQSFYNTVYLLCWNQTPHCSISFFLLLGTREPWMVHSVHTVPGAYVTPHSNMSIFFPFSASVLSYFWYPLSLYLPCTFALSSLVSSPRKYPLLRTPIPPHFDPSPTTTRTLHPPQTLIPHPAPIPTLHSPVGWDRTGSPSVTIELPNYGHRSYRYVNASYCLLLPL